MNSFLEQFPLPMAYGLNFTRITSSGLSVFELEIASKIDHTEEETLDH